MSDGIGEGTRLGGAEGDNDIKWVFGELLGPSLPLPLESVGMVVGSKVGADVPGSTGGRIGIPTGGTERDTGVLVGSTGLGRKIDGSIVGV